LISTSALRTKFIKSLERDRKKFTAELESVNNQLAALNGPPKKVVAFADMAHHRVADPRKGRKLSKAHRLAIKRGIAASKKAKANGK
jgi:uncharacterized protein YciW